jgi:hypothetical protein
MNKIILTVLLTALLSLSSFAQKNKTTPLADFSGTWLLDESKSFKTAEEKEYFEDFTLDISQKEPDITIVERYLFRRIPAKRTISLFTDKRGEENSYFILRDRTSRNDEDLFSIEDVSVKSKTYSKNGKIVREGSYKPDFGGFTFLMKETYSLSGDGQTLMLTTEKRVLGTADSTLSSFERDPPSGYSLKPASTWTYRFVFHKK